MTLATRVLVLRHGQSEWNAAGKWQGQADIELTDLGYEQARRAADKLGQFAAVASSDLRRARVTAAIIAESLGLGLLDPDPRLRETDVGEWQGLTHDEIERDWPGHLEAHLRPPTFEADASIVTRVGAALFDLAAAFPGEEVLCVAHAGVIRVLRRVLGAPDSRVPNLGGCPFVLRPGHAQPIEAEPIVELFEHGEIGEEL
ncbi:MAG: histidine phosphatase family protein [Ilumatobacteraceae bacterium]